MFNFLFFGSLVAFGFYSASFDEKYIKYSKHLKIKELKQKMKNNPFNNVDLNNKKTN